MARAWCDAARFHVAVNAGDFQVPEEVGLVDWLESGVEASEAEPDLELIVAEVDGEVVGFAGARLVAPASDARWQMQREMAVTRLIVDAVAVAERFRSHGAGEALVRAAEDWGRGEGATIAIADANWESGAVGGFYEKRLGYRRRSVSLRRAL
jgi:GNAT superfamily N-acetyltransferase